MHGTASRVSNASTTALWSQQMGSLGESAVPGAASADGAEAEGQTEEGAAGAAGDATEQQDEDATENESYPIKEEGGGRKRKDNEDADEPAKRSRR